MSKREIEEIRNKISILVEEYANHKYADTVFVPEVTPVPNSGDRKSVV